MSLRWKLDVDVVFWQFVAMNNELVVCECSQHTGKRRLVMMNQLAVSAVNLPFSNCTTAPGHYCCESSVWMCFQKFVMIESS